VSAAGPTPAEPGAVRWTILGISALAVAIVAGVIYGQPHTDPARTPSGLASLNAVLNAAAAACLLTGYAFIRRKRIAAHRRSMLAAFALSCAFLVSYVAHHAQVGSVTYAGQGAWRTLYFGLLIPHIVGAAVVVPLALFTIYRGWTGRIEAHRRIARVALPLWLYVSVSGVVLYLLLYR
jgi:putative membrane protein